MTTDKIRVSVYLSSENYQQLQEYMTRQELSQTKAINAIIGSYLTDKPEDELTGQIMRLEQQLSDLKRHVLALRFR
ncbi:MAG TPA: hypothetical protein V6D14_17870 [Coleofasciculaceae cyanobacterium]|jgi:polyhydroxyalkanoate synthesis regulator phasin